MTRTLKSDSKNIKQQQRYTEKKKATATDPKMDCQKNPKTTTICMKKTAASHVAKVKTKFWSKFTNK